MDDPFESIFVPIILDLREVLGDLVVIGGWVPELHRRFGGPGDWAVKPLATTEVDVLLGGPNDSAGSHRILAETLAKAGFSPVRAEGTSAVWERDIVIGERVEFFLDSTGPWEDLARVQTLDEDLRLGALSLRGLGVLRENSTVLRVPIQPDQGPATVAMVRVPELGAFLAHKGATFRQRPELPKRVKDLHYIVDVMQSGELQIEAVEKQIAKYCSEKGSAGELARQARNHIGLVTGEAAGTALRQGLAEGLSVRHGLSLGEGDARARGYLADFMEMIPEGCEGLT